MHTMQTARPTPSRPRPGRARGGMAFGGGHPWQPLVADELVAALAVVNDRASRVPIAVPVEERAIEQFGPGSQFRIGAVKVDVQLPDRVVRAVIAVKADRGIAQQDAEVDDPADEEDISPVVVVAPEEMVVPKVPNPPCLVAPTERGSRGSGSKVIGASLVTARRPLEVGSSRRAFLTEGRASSSMAAGGTRSSNVDASVRSRPGSALVVPVLGV